jgi:hypothetical protein
VPEAFRERLEVASRSNLYDQLRYASEFLGIRKALAKEGIEAVPYKGFWFGHEYYGNMADREGVDIDLMISFSDLEKAMALMPELGYRSETSDDPRFIRKILKESAEYNFDKYDGDVRLFHVEYHWKMGSSSHGMDISLDDLRNQVVTGRIQGNEFPVFNASANLLLAVMHHAGKDQMIKLKQVLDIGRIIHRGFDIDWDWLLRIAGRIHIEKGVYLSVRLASQITGIEIPEALQQKLNAGDIRRLTEGRVKAMEAEPDWWYSRDYDRDELMFHLRLRNSFTVRSRLLFNHVKGRIVGLITPKRLLRFYLRRRYNINPVVDR